MLYRYSLDRKGEHPRAHLEGFAGILQADGYIGFKALYADGRIAEASCWAHARRGFFEAYEKTQSPLAREALDRIVALYRIEDLARGRTVGERMALRTARSATLMDERRMWLEATLTRISGRSELAQAIRYALARWNSLTHVLRDVASASTTRPPSGPCAPSRSGGATGPLQDRTQAVRVPPRFTA